MRVRQAVRDLAVAAKLSLVDQTKLVTAASELARNTLVYGGGGRDASRSSPTGRARASGPLSPTRGPASPTSSWRSPTAGPAAAAWGSACRAHGGSSTSSSCETGPGEGTLVKIVKWTR